MGLHVCGDATDSYGSAVSDSKKQAAGESRQRLENSTRADTMIAVERTLRWLCKNMQPVNAHSAGHSVTASSSSPAVIDPSGPIRNALPRTSSSFSRSITGLCTVKR